MSRRPLGASLPPADRLVAYEHRIRALREAVDALEFVLGADGSESLVRAQIGHLGGLPGRGFRALRGKGDPAPALAPSLTPSQRLDAYERHIRSYRVASDRLDEAIYAVDTGHDFHGRIRADTAWRRFEAAALELRALRERVFDGETVAPA